MAPLEIIENDPARQIERDIDVEDCRTPVTPPQTRNPDVPEAAALTPPVTPRCGTQQREFLGQPFSEAPLHRRAR
jgi:hypothetical protein